MVDPRVGAQLAGDAGRDAPGVGHAVALVRSLKPLTIVSTKGSRAISRRVPPAAARSQMEVTPLSRRTQGRPCPGGGQSTRVAVMRSEAQAIWCPSKSKPLRSCTGGAKRATACARPARLAMTRKLAFGPRKRSNAIRSAAIRMRVFVPRRAKIWGRGADGESHAMVVGPARANSTRR